MSVRTKILLITLLLIALCTSGCNPAGTTPSSSDSGNGTDSTLPTVTEADTSADTDTEMPADTSDMPPAESTGDDTVPLPDTTEEIPPETVALPIVISTPIGQYADNLDIGTFPPEKIEYEFSHYSLPAGMIYDAVFSGTRTETELIIDADSTLVLYVSIGIAFENVQVPADDRTIYLTFDDGPSPKNTTAILDILDEYGIKATFFLIGSSVERYPDLVRDIYDRGHAIGCHSFTHEYSDIYKDAESLLREIDRWEIAVENALGFVPEERLFRFPGGSLTCKDSTIREVLAAEGFRCFDWNTVNNDCLLHTRDVGVSEEDFIKDSVTSTLAYSFRLKESPHIMLMHDTYAQTAEFLPWMIEYMTALGCSFDTLDKLTGGWLH